METNVKPLDYPSVIIPFGNIQHVTEETIPAIVDLLLEFENLPLKITALNSSCSFQPEIELTQLSSRNMVRGTPVTVGSSGDWIGFNTERVLYTISVPATVYHVPGRALTIVHRAPSGAALIWILEVESTETKK